MVGFYMNNRFFLLLFDFCDILEIVMLFLGFVLVLWEICFKLNFDILYLLLILLMIFVFILNVLVMFFWNSILYILWSINLFFLIFWNLLGVVDNVVVDVVWMFILFWVVCESVSWFCFYFNVFVGFIFFCVGLSLLFFCCFMIKFCVLSELI